MIRKTWTLEWTKNEMKIKERTKSSKIKKVRRTTQKTKRRRSKTKSPKEQRNWRKTQKDRKRARIFQKGHGRWNKTYSFSLTIVQENGKQISRENSDANSRVEKENLVVVMRSASSAWSWRAIRF